MLQEMLQVLPLPTLILAERSAQLSTTGLDSASGGNRRRWWSGICWYVRTADGAEHGTG